MNIIAYICSPTKMRTGAPGEDIKAPGPVVDLLPYTFDRPVGTVKLLTDDAEYNCHLFDMRTASFVHNNRREDRRWAFECKSTGGQHSYCSWTSNYVNDWDEFFNYQCSNDGFICGMRSIHHNKKEDRRFMFKCCQISGKTLSECSKTYRNDFDKPFTVNVPSGFVIRSVSSTHSNKYEDRQFSWELCKL
ncbi:unnamed protein product [Mytilus coruscus]|uniref:Uncharacterized protein n=1 Tax=Mytilus coruscus TaxID=42192 RepID=A0A6J8CSK8_MYTCO|nr:unnamed protein product [Mytilus coruscus]